jgi:acetyltransferase
MEQLFEPRSVAVVGAAREPNKVGYIILRNMLNAGYSGRLHPVNPKAEEILGLRCYPTLLHIPEEVDLAVVAVPPAAVYGVMEHAAQKGIKAAIIITAGYKETGKEGSMAESDLAALCAKNGIRVLGPNCLGLINTAIGMNATFVSGDPNEGGIAISSQSGAICAVLLDWASGVRSGFSKFVSVGNKMDIEEAYILSYLRRDERTKVIGMYVEGINRGPEFLREASATSRQKPVIMLKAGRTASGAKAASSHTGALSGSDRVYEAAMLRAGVMRARNIEELIDLLLIFSTMPLPQRPSVAIVTNAGGLGVMAADAVSDYGISLASLTPATLEKLHSRLPPTANFYNPVDVIGDADAERYSFAVRAVLDDENVGAVLALMAPADLVDTNAVATALARLAAETAKPIAAAFVGGSKLGAAIETLRRSGVPNYDSPDRAVRAVAAMSTYAHLRSREEWRPEPRHGDAETARAVITRVRAEGRLQLSEGEGKEILRCYGIPVPEEGLARSPEEASEIASRVGFPVVMKIESPDIAHKTDVGGVALGIGTADAAADAFEQMVTRIRSLLPEARLNGVSVQKMVRGREVIVGMTRDEQFGPVITFGLGGIFVEVLKDVSQRLAPLSAADADELIRSIRAYPILTGARGRRPSDIRALREVLLRLSQMAEDLPELAEMEINPVMVDDEGKGVGAVDALATLKRETT